MAKRYEARFQRKVALAAQKSKRSIKSIAKIFSVSPKSVSRWLENLENGSYDQFGIHPASYGDRRMLAYCIHCGSRPSTEDHNPSYVFLDHPYQDELPTVGVCGDCNNGFSADEPYLACAIDAALTGSAIPNARWRRKTKTVFKNDRRLQGEIAKAEIPGAAWLFDHERVQHVIEKLARGHAAFELHDYPGPSKPTIRAVALHTLSAEVRSAFEQPPSHPGWPEVGSRALSRLFEQYPSQNDAGWIVVQEGRYRYAASGSGDETVVRIVFSEYLGAEVVWSSETDDS